MSTAVPPPVQSSSQRDVAAAPADADRLIEQRIHEACEALWWSELTRAILKLLILSIMITLVWVVIDQWIYSPNTTPRWVIFFALIASGIWYLARFVVPLLGSSIRPEYAARSLERDFPELRQSLTSYVALRNDRVGSQLRHRVVRSIGASTAGHLRTHDVLPAEAAGTFRWWIGTAVALALLLAYGVASPKNSLQSAARLVAPFASIDPAVRVLITDVQPGNTEAVAGRPVTVSAKIDGLRDDEQAFLAWQRPDVTDQVVLDFDSETRRYTGELSLTHSDTGLIPYTIEAGDAIAGPYELMVQDVPVVAIASIHYQPPAYTKQSAWTGSGGAIHALDGTEVAILATTNRPIVKANIEFNPRPLGDAVQATAGVTAMKIEGDGMSVSVAFPLRSSRGRSAAVELDGYRISVWDSAGQRNPDPIIYPIQVITDLPPEVAIMMPRKSPKDLPIDAQQVIEIHASDPDFGLQQIALEIRSGIDLIDQPVLWADKQGATGNQVAEYRLRPREHGLRIGDTVQVIAVATDNRRLEHDPSVEPNTSRTDAIEFKIVAGEPPPRGEDQQADGVSPPDERPASDQAEDNSKSGSPDGQPQQAGSGGSEGNGQQQQGGSSGGESSSGKDGEAGEDQNNPTGSGSNDGPGQGENSQPNSPPGDSSSKRDSTDQGDPSEGESSEGESSEGEPSADEPSADEPSADEPSADEPREGESNESGDPNSAGQPSGNDPNGGQNGKSAQQETAGDTDNRNDPSGTANETGVGEKRAGQEPAGQERAGQERAGQERAGQERAGQEPAGEEGRGQANDPQSSGSGDQNRQPDERQADGGQEDSVPEGDNPPQHDGEAFERIRDHLEQKRQQQQNSNQQPGKQNQSQGQPGQDGSENRQGTEGQAAPDEESAGEQSQSQDPPNDNDKGEEPKDEGSQGNQNPTEGQEGDSSSDAADKQGEDGMSKGDDAAKSKSSPGSEQGSEGKREQGDEGSPDSKSAETTQDGESGNPSDSAKPGDQKSASESNPGKPSSQSNSQPGTGGDGESQGGDSVLPPEEANAEYAKQATDMVLDYLDQTRDEPDRELLDKLKWSKDDLKRFADRWKKVREVAGNNSDPNTNREITEALKSLGMKPKVEDSNNSIRETADSLRSIRDSGNRRPPPAAYRDAFDAFRRAAGRK